MIPDDLASYSDGYSCGESSILLLPLLLQFLNVYLCILSKIFIDDPYMTSRCTACPPVCATEICVRRNLLSPSRQLHSAIRGKFACAARTRPGVRIQIALAAAARVWAVGADHGPNRCTACPPARHRNLCVPHFSRTITLFALSNLWRVCLRSAGPSLNVHTHCLGRWCCQRPGRMCTNRCAFCRPGRTTETGARRFSPSRSAVV